jgi:flagellar biosynthetic protein FliR
MERDLLLWIVEHYGVYALVVLRITGMLFLMPVFSSRSIPVQVKAATILITALALTPVAPFSPDQLPSNPWQFGLLAVAEFFAGMTLALILRLVFAGLQMAAQMVGFQMGLAMASIVDPQSGTQSIVIAQFVYLIALLLFLAMDGHHMMLSLLHESLSVLSPGDISLSEPLYSLIFHMGQQMFVLSVKLMAPVMAILLFSQVAMGILAKAVPQINMLIVSFGLNIALGLFFLGFTLQILGPVLARSLEDGMRLMPAAMNMLAGN